MMSIHPLALYPRGTKNQDPHQGINFENSCSKVNSHKIIFVPYVRLTAVYVSGGGGGG